MIRRAVDSDREPVLQFCQNTFSWGDYVECVWDYWLKEGSLLVYDSFGPVGICHAIPSKDQLWIEGIRVSSSHRRQKIASQLIGFSEKIGLQNKALASLMLIDASNTASLNLAASLGYSVIQTWRYYLLQPMAVYDVSIKFEKTIDSKSYPMYVDSWRWLALDDSSIDELSSQDRIISSSVSENSSLSVITESKHFDDTLIATLFSNNQKSTSDILSYLQNLCMESGFERVQVLTREELPCHEGMGHKLTFHLLKKSLDMALQ